MLRYIELKTGYSNNGPAWIGHVRLSRSGRTVYFDGKAFKRCKGVSGNHYEVETGDEYWISGVKKDGQDRHWAGAGKVIIESGAVAEYLNAVGSDRLDSSKFVVSNMIRSTEPSEFLDIENASVVISRAADMNRRKD